MNPGNLFAPGNTKPILWNMLTEDYGVDMSVHPHSGYPISGHYDVYREDLLVRVLFEAAGATRDTRQAHWKKLHSLVILDRASMDRKAMREWGVSGTTKHEICMAVIGRMKGDPAPGVAIAPPSVAIAPPSVAIAPPSVAIAPPSVAIASPSVAIASPSVAIASPSVAIASPSVAIASPSVAIASPSVAIKSPSVATKSPGEAAAPPVSGPPADPVPARPDNDYAIVARHFAVVEYGLWLERYARAGGTELPLWNIQNGKEFGENGIKKRSLEALKLYEPLVAERIANSADIKVSRALTALRNEQTTARDTTSGHVTRTQETFRDWQKLQLASMRKILIDLAT